MDYYVKVDGGIGRVLASTGVLESFAALKHKEGHTVNVVSSFPQIFDGLDVDRVYHLTMPYLYEDYIRKGEFLEPEPYNSRLYYADSKHLASVFNSILTGSQEFIRPHLVLTDNELLEARLYIEGMRNKHGKKVLLIQPWGSTGGIGLSGGGVKADESYRSFSYKFYSKFAEELSPEFTLLSVQNTANNDGNQGPQISLKDTIVVNHNDVRRVFALIPFVDGVVACDSMLHHASAALGTPVKTFVYWGGTDARNLGYQEHTNFVPVKPVLIEPNRVPHNRAYYVSKNKGCNDFDLGSIDVIRKAYSTPLLNSK